MHSDKESNSQVETNNQIYNTHEILQYEKHEIPLGNGKWWCLETYLELSEDTGAFGSPEFDNNVHRCK